MNICQILDNWKNNNNKLNVGQYGTLLEHGKFTPNDTEFLSGEDKFVILPNGQEFIYNEKEIYEQFKSSDINRLKKIG